MRDFLPVRSYYRRFPRLLHGLGVVLFAVLDLLYFPDTELISVVLAKSQDIFLRDSHWGGESIIVYLYITHGDSVHVTPAGLHRNTTSACPRWGRLLIEIPFAV